MFCKYVDLSNIFTPTKLNNMEKSLFLHIVHEADEAS